MHNIKVEEGKDKQMRTAKRKEYKPSWEQLYYKYSHIGCPHAHMEDNCAHPDRCADNGKCIDLPPLKSNGDGNVS